METKELNNNKGCGKAMPGLVLVLLGIVYLLQNIGLLPAELRPFLHSWQMIIVIVGMFTISGQKYIKGSSIILIGIVLMLPIFQNVFPEIFIGLPNLNFRNLWPVILIVLGCVFVLKSYFNKGCKTNRWHDETHFKSRHHRQTSDYKNLENSFDINTIFNGTKHIILSQEFEGGEVNVLFGEAQVNLQKVQISPNNALIEANVLFGSIVISVPADWNVSFDVTAMFGSGQDKRTAISDYDVTKPKLIIKGNCLFASIELIN